MKKVFALIFLIATLITLGMVTASADTYENLTYEIIDDEAVITICDSSATVVEIPAQIETYPVTGIGDYAFSYTGVTSVTIPASVKTIEELAFSNASYLESISVDENNAYYASADGVLFDKNMTKLLCHPVGKTTTSYIIPDTVTTIGKGAFGSNWNLTSITIGKSVNDIDAREFSDCLYLESILADADSECYSSADGILFNKSKTELVRYPMGKSGETYTTPIGITSIGACAFEQCYNLINITLSEGVTSIGTSAFEDCKVESIKLPDGLVSIGENAFKWCSKLTSESIALPNSLTAIGKGAFTGCLGLTSITIPDGVTVIEDFTFYYCEGLTNVKTGKGVKIIGSYAFSGCSGLTDITDILGNSVESIGLCAFEECTGLKNITIPDSVTEIYYEAFIGCTGLKNAVIGKGMTYVAGYMFSGCSGLTSVSIPDTVTIIQNSAFINCTGLQSITIGEGVSHIASSSFEGCKRLESITIPKSVTIISDAVFKGCDSLKTVNYNGTEEDWNDIWKDWDNDPLVNATMNYFWYVKYVDADGKLIQKDMVSHNTVTAPSADLGDASEGIFFEDEYLTIAFDFTAPITKDTIVYVKGSSVPSSPYKINSITIKDASGKTLAAIPASSFLATVSITNKNADGDNVVVLAQYSSKGTLSGLMYVSVEDMPTGATFKLTIPVENTTGNVAKLKAFVWDSLDSMTSLGNTVTFPAE